jgi:hypothetical protein
LGKGKFVSFRGKFTKDHLILHLTGNTTAWHMWETLKTLFQNKSENWNMVLREKLREIRMTNSKKVTSYLTRIQQVRAELVGNDVADTDLVRMTHTGFSEQWKLLIKGFVPREKLPN